MGIGYACLTEGVEGIKYKACRKENASDENLKEAIDNNLAALDKMLDYNIKSGVRMMRITSDIIPFGSHPVNRLRWWEVFENELNSLGKKAKENKIRLSMHPGQYTVLNSPNKEVVEKAVANLAYHARFLDSLDLDGSSKMVLHIGGAYGNKKEALERFAKNYVNLAQNIKDRLVLENDDKIFNIEEVLVLGSLLSAPVVYDNLHNKLNHCMVKSDKDWIVEAGKTWKEKDGRQKIHYSQQAEGKKPGSHSDTIDVGIFSKFYEEVDGDRIDIMLEVKDKNLSAVKCINAVERKNILELEKEWAKYKYLVLEHSPKIYNEIRELLKNKQSYPVLEFYDLIDKAVSGAVNPGQAVNAAEHVWGYFSKNASVKVKDKIAKLINKVSEGGQTGQLKKILFKLAKENDQKYLLESLYFKNVI